MHEALDTRRLFDIVGSALWSIHDHASDVASTVRQNADDPRAFLLGASGGLSGELDRIEAALALARAAVSVAHLNAGAP